MPYTPLDLPADLPESVRAVVAEVEKYLYDVHCLLATPNRETTPGRQFQLPVALTLLTAVAGISSHLYRRKRKDKSRFIGCLEDFYPWDLDPPEGVPPRKACEELYEAFRNPLLHDVGVSFQQIGKMKLGQIFPGTDDASERIAELERTEGKPFDKAAVVVTPEKRVLWTNAFYWGVRRMIERMLRDEELVASAENALSERSRQRH